MKGKMTLLIIIFMWFILFFTLRFSAIAYIDAPHNESNNISCGSCHGQGLLNSPFWGGSGTYDQICLSCHTESSGPYTPTGAPLVKTHSSENTSDKYGNWTRECRNCHDPHYQRQKFYKMTDSGNLYLATGTITDCVYNGGDGTSTLTYSTITYKSGWDAGKLTEKTGEYRRTIIFPNVDKLGYSYPVLAVDTPTVGTITVKGDACTSLTPPTTYAVMYGQYVKDYVSVSGSSSRVKFLDHEGVGSFADGGGVYDGICEVCHTQTEHYRNDGTAPDQNHANLGGKDGTNCSTCHKHTKGFFHGGDCTQCHGHENGWMGGTYYGTTISHSTHTENDDDDVKGPYKACNTCHDTNDYPTFVSGTDSNGDGKYDLSETDVCDTCHSPGGSFNGLVSSGSSVGGKTNWKDGIYQASGDLASGKEKWCAGCHDNVPAVVDGNTAPDIVGDNSTYGYYLNAHGNGTYGVNNSSRSYAIGECVNCHATDNISSTSSHGGQLFATNNADFCLQCHRGTGSVQVGGVTNYMYSKTFGGESGSHGITSVYDAFNASGSTHDLASILSYAKSKGWVPSSDNNACLVCHIDVHKLKPNKRHPQDPTYTVLRLPSEYSTNPDNLWGDEADERMNSITTKYIAPYFSGTGSREPGGTSSTNGSKHPDYVTFCKDCHYELDNIYWDGTPAPNRPQCHGEGRYSDPVDYGDCKSPWAAEGDYVLSCLDCHEPHGSTNRHLLRTELNNTSNVTYTRPSKDNPGNWCFACHKNVSSSHYAWYTYCDECHTHYGDRPI